MNRILFLGMDLSGKSHASFNTANILGRDIRPNLLTIDRTIYNKAVNKMRTENLTDKEKLYLFGTIYQNDLDNFKHSTKEQDILLVQDNLGIVRNISYFYYMGYEVEDLIRILKSYPQPEHCFYLTCSNEERIRRLEERTKNKTEDVYEKLLRENPKIFFELDSISYNFYTNYFDCDFVNNTNMTEEETLQYVLKRVGK